MREPPLNLDLLVLVQAVRQSFYKEIIPLFVEVQPPGHEVTISSRVGRQRGEIQVTDTITYRANIIELVWGDRDCWVRKFVDGHELWRRRVAVLGGYADRQLASLVRRGVGR